MRCALHKEILYLDKEIENIETLRDINNKKIKCTKSYYINNTNIFISNGLGNPKLLLDYFIKNNYTQCYAIDIKNTNLKTDFPDNCFIDIGLGKMYCLKLSESKIYNFYGLDKMMSNKVRDWDVDTFVKYCNKFNEMKVGISISNYAGKKMKSSWSALNSKIIDDNVAALLLNAYHGGYFLNPEPLKVHEGKFWDYDYNAAYLDAAEKNSNISGLFYVTASINEVPAESR